MAGSYVSLVPEASVGPPGLQGSVSLALGWGRPGAFAESLSQVCSSSLEEERGITTSQGHEREPFPLLELAEYMSNLDNA